MRIVRELWEWKPSHFLWESISFPFSFPFTMFISREEISQAFYITFEWYTLSDWCVEPSGQQYHKSMISWWLSYRNSVSHPLFKLGLHIVVIVEILMITMMSLVSKSDGQIESYYKIKFQWSTSIHLGEIYDTLLIEINFD